MTISAKIRVAVLFGGRSAEHEVSLKSAANVIQNLDPDLFEVVPVGIDKLGNWFLGHDIFTHSLEHKTVAKLQKETWFTPEWIGKQVDVRFEPKTLLSSNGPVFDVVFPVVHGTLCEDGTLQGLLELANVPYVGCGVLASAVGMDKDVSKRLAILADVPVAPYIAVKHDKWLTVPDAVTKEVTAKLTYPLFVKPANTGSSIGITKVKTPDALKAALDEAFCFDTKVLIENGLDILELEVAALESLDNNTDPIVSVVGEIKPSHEFYSYDAKYVDENGAELFIPASVSEVVREKAQTIAKKLFRALECEGMARIDLFYEKNTQQIYFNEINTIPGFTQISMYPKLMAASGLAYTDLLTHLIQLAIKRHQCKTKLQRSYQEA
jgi:D-alanine-D-alanine ligase